MRLINDLRDVHFHFESTDGVIWNLDTAAFRTVLTLLAVVTDTLTCLA